MKKIFLIILFLTAVFSFNTYAQSDSSKGSAKENETKVEKGDDQIMPSFEKSKRKKDVFIDKDGDGICDNRAEGMSFEKMRKRKQKGKESGNHGGRK
jgi:hypothetical protein